MESDFVFSVFSKCRFGYFVSSMEVRNETSVVVSSGIKFFWFATMFVHDSELDAKPKSVWLDCERPSSIPDSVFSDQTLVDSSADGTCTTYRRSKLLKMDLFVRLMKKISMPSCLSWTCSQIQLLLYSNRSR